VGKGQGVLRLGELDARVPSFGDDVVDLLGDFSIGKRRKVRKGLEELVVDWGPHLEDSSGGGSIGHGELRGSGLVEKGRWLKTNVGLGWRRSSLGFGCLDNLRGNSNECSHGRHGE
jgi:hypothetical protein